MIPTVVYKTLLEKEFYTWHTDNAIAVFLFDGLDRRMTTIVIPAYIREAQFDGEAWQTSQHYKAIYKEIIKPKVMSIRDGLENFVIHWFGNYAFRSLRSEYVPHLFQVQFAEPTIDQFEHLHQQATKYVLAKSALYHNFELWSSYIVYKELKAQGLYTEFIRLGKAEAYEARSDEWGAWLDLWKRFIDHTPLASEMTLCTIGLYLYLQLEHCETLEAKYFT